MKPHPSLQFSRRRWLRAGGLGLLGCGLWPGLARAATARPPKFLLEWGKRGEGKGEFHSPVGLAINHREEILVTDVLNERVQIFRPDGRFLSMFSTPKQPGGIAVDRAGRIYIAHWSLHKIAVYEPDGRMVREWGQKGSAPGEFDLPGGLAVASNGLIYVPDQANARIQVFTPEGKFLRQWGELGGGPGQFGLGRGIGSRFAGPQFLALDRHDNVYATDTQLGRVQKFTSEGKFRAVWGGNSKEPGGFGGRETPPEGPIALCMDRRDRVWVGASNHLVQQFEQTGKYLRGFGGEGEGPGQFRTPHGLAFNRRGDLYVVDTRNHRVQKFAVSG